MTTNQDTTNIQAYLKAAADAALAEQIAIAEQEQKEKEGEKDWAFRGALSRYLITQWGLSPEQAGRILVDSQTETFSIGTWTFRLYPQTDSAALITGVCPECGAPRLTRQNIHNLADLGAIINDPNPPDAPGCNCWYTGETQTEAERWWDNLDHYQANVVYELVSSLIAFIDEKPM